MGKRVTIYLTNEELEILEKLKKKMKLNTSRIIKEIIKSYKCNTKK